MRFSNVFMFKMVANAIVFVDHKNDKKYFRSRGKFRQAGPDRAAETAVADALCGLA